jgi:hypothetical protein
LAKLRKDGRIDKFELQPSAVLVYLRELPVLLPAARPAHRCRSTEALNLSRSIRPKLANLGKVIVGTT